MELQELRAAVEAGAVDTVLLAITDMQGRLQGKRLHARHFLDEVVEHGAEGCTYLLAVDVDMATVDGYAMASWERGYGDFVVRPDLSTLRPVPWHEGTAMCLADVVWHDGSPVAASPRQILRRQLERLAERGWTAHAGTELEFIVFRDSYDGSFAPTAVAWGHDNRTCALRVVGHGPSLRFENRVGGADLNPYLALSAIIAAGLHGVDAGLALEPPLEGDAYRSDRPRVPTTLREARDLFARSAVAREAFGDEVVEHYLNAARVEIDAYDAAVTDWERVRGFERL
ncbi:MAG: hypothetical protein IRZ32_11410 [Solirubrobacteraceae bacterium]|mgnify:CR=1 FL=1|nr:hypothetical protein [Solirubrobacteraceae bacterium]